MIRRAHPLYILIYFSKFFLIYLISLLHNLVIPIPSGKGLWSGETVFSLLFLLVSFTYSIINWYLYNIELSSDDITVIKGIFHRHRISFPRSVPAVSLLKPWYLRPFRAALLYIDTGSGYPSGSISVPVFTSFANQFIQSDDIPPAYVSKFRQNAAYSIASSNSFGGILIISAGIRQAGLLIGRQAAEQIYDRLGSLSQLAAFHIPPAAATVGLLILTGWLAAFLLNLQRYLQFVLFRKENAVMIRFGFMTLRHRLLIVSRIAYLDIRQTLLSAGLGLCSVFAAAAGRRSEKSIYMTVIPSEKTCSITERLANILPEFIPCLIQSKRSWRLILRFLWIPVLLLCGIPASQAALIRFLPRYEGLIRLFMLILTIPILWYAAIRIFEFLSSGIAYHEDTFTLRYSRGFYLHTVVIPKRNLGGIRLRQSFLQKKTGQCDLSFYTFVDGDRIAHTVLSLNIAQAVSLMQQIH